MKKFVLSMAVALTLFATACSNPTKSVDQQADDLKTKIENASASDVQSYVKEAQAFAEKLVKEGKVEEAKKYLDIIEPVVKEKAPQFAATFDMVNSAIGRLGTKAEDVKDAAKDAAENAVSDAKDAAEAKATEAVNGVKDAAEAKANEAVSKANDAANQAVNKAADAADKAVSNAADKAKGLFK